MLTHAIYALRWMHTMKFSFQLWLLASSELSYHSKGEEEDSKKAKKQQQQLQRQQQLTKIHFEKEKRSINRLFSYGSFIDF